jgi:hypothetical protein
MAIAGFDSTHKLRGPSRSNDMSFEGGKSNYRYELSPEEREKFDAALAAVTRIKATFDDWVIIGRAIVAARKHADHFGGRKAFQNILAEQRIMPPLDQASVSRVEKIMSHLDDVVRWRATLTERQQLIWAGPTSIVNRFPAFKVEKEQCRAATPRKPTRLDNALEENVALKAEIERHRRSNGDDCGFSRKDRAEDIADVIVSALSEHKRHALLAVLVRKLGTKKQRAAFGFDNDDPPAPSIPAANGAAA